LSQSAILADRINRGPAKKSHHAETEERPAMGKGNNSQKNDKKNKKPKQDAKKPAEKSGGKK